MKECGKKCLVCLFTLLAKINFLRRLIVSCVIFNPPEVSYTIRHHYFIGRSPSFTVDFEKSQCSSQTEQNMSPIRLKSKLKRSVTLIKEKLNIRQYPRICYPTLNTSQKIQRRIPCDQFKYPDKVFKIIDAKLNTQFVESLDGLSFTSYVLNSNSGNLLSSIYIENESSQQIILFSHGNSCDLGWMIDQFFDLSLECQINIFAYDYSGYGQSTGDAYDISAIHDIDAAYIFLIDQLNFLPKNIIVYGYSVGSGPSTNLASRQYIGGLIIHSGLSSGLRVLNQNIKETPYHDVFPNIDYIVDVAAPVFILHGGADSMINVVHAEQLAQKCQHLFSVWLVEYGGHNNIDSDWKDQYNFRLKTFINYCQKAVVLQNIKQKRTISHYYDEFDFENQQSRKKQYEYQQDLEF